MPATAEEIAKVLAYEFLRDGRYSAAHGAVEMPQFAQAVGLNENEDVRSEIQAFEGLAVQSVGYEDGAPEPKVHIYLTKSSGSQIKSLPSSIDGVEVRAHRMGNIVVRPEAAASATNYGQLFERKGRIACGSSCGPTSETCTGTMGALVRKTGGTQVFLLSNNHVFAGCNHVQRGQPILAPSTGDSRPNVRSPAEIGRHAEIRELRSGNPAFVTPCDADLALATATNLNSISSWQGDASGYDTPATVASPLSLMKVKKFGRTTGLTIGEVEARVNTPMPVSYTAKYFKGTIWFNDVWTIKGTNGPFALPGDSGSLVVTEDGQSAVGLVFAAAPTADYAWIIPMPVVVSAFGGLDLVTGHGT